MAGKPTKRIDLDVARAFELELERHDWQPLGTDVHKNYAGDQIIRHHSYAANAEIRYELRVIDAMAIAPNGKGGMTTHATEVLDEIKSYMSEAGTGVRRKLIAGMAKERAGGNHG